LKILDVNLEVLSKIIELI